MNAEAGWYRDPTGRYEQRHWDGSVWTERVRSGAGETLDPLADATSSSDADPATVASSPAARGAVTEAPSDVAAQAGPEAAAPTGTMAPPGWFEDPRGGGNLRYWDGAEWTEHVHTPVPSAGGAAPSVSAAAAAGINTWLVPAIFATVLCWAPLPLGIIGIVYAAQARSRAEEGDLVAARRAAGRARMWTLIAVGLWVLLAIVAVVGFTFLAPTIGNF